jgi:hypothetical protein
MTNNIKTTIMKTKIIFVLPLIVLLFSCAKERTIKVSALNPATGIGYADLRITIYASKTGADGEELTKVYEGNLNDNGEVYATFNVKKGRYYVIKCQSPTNVNVCYTNNTTYTYDIHDPNNREFTFEIAPCAYSKLTINNVNCEGPNDLMVLYRSNQIGTSDGNFGWQHNGCAFWQTNGQSDIPMGKVYYRWEVTRSSGTTIHYDTVYYAPGVLTEYEINY